MANSETSYLRSIGLLVLFFIPFVGHSAAPPQVEPRITGKYSNMQYVPEAGDVVGYELRIVYTAVGLQGTLQVAEGVPGPLIIVDVVQNGSSVSFEIPGDTTFAGEFHGTVANGWLNGEFRFKEGSKETVALRKGKSYWD